MKRALKYAWYVAAFTAFVTFAVTFGRIAGALLLSIPVPE